MLIFVYAKKVISYVQDQYFLLCNALCNKLIAMRLFLIPLYEARQCLEAEYQT